MRITKFEDNTGREVILDYNANGLLVAVTDVLENTWEYAYHTTNHKLISATDPLENTYLTASYDAQFRISTYEANAGPWTFTYQTTTTVEDAFDNSWVYGYNAVTGITTAITEPTGGTHHITLDSAFNAVGYRPPGSLVTTMGWTYDTKNRPLTYTPPGVGSHNIEYDYDSVDNWVDEITGLDDGVTTFTRDAEGRVTEQVEPEGGTWTASYAANGDLLTLTEPNGNAPGGSGHEWSFSYDDLGGVTTAEDPTGREFEFEYTNRGDLWKLRRPDHHDAQQELVYAERTYGRDAKGRIVSVTDPLENAWTKTYDAAGRLTDEEGPDGSHTEYAYDSRHRLISRTEHDGVSDPETTYAYDAAGRLTTKTLPDGGSWTYTYDASGRLATRTDPMLRTWSHTRDSAGRVTTLTHPGGQQVSMTYSSTSGKMTQRSFPGGRVEAFTYDTVTGRLSEVTVEDGDWSGRIEWDHDLLGRVVRIETAIDDGTGELSRELLFTYDANGNRSTLESLPIGETLSYSYDELNRLVGTGSDVYDDWTVTYDPDSGHRIGVAAGEREKSWQYDLAGRIIAESWSWPGEDDGDFTYELDAAGRRITDVDQLAGVTLDRQYDSLGLLAQLDRTVDDETETTTFSYDLAGRIVGRERTDALGKTETSVFEWDAAGRIIYGRMGKHIRLYTWDDTPEDPSAALRVWRSTTDLEDPGMEFLYGFDNRLQQMTGKNLGEDPFTIVNYRWTPLADHRAFEVTERLEDESSETRRMALDVGGYYAELTTGFVDTNLVHPVLGVGQARRAGQRRLGPEMPNPVAPFEMGAWRLNPTPAQGVDSTPTLAGQATAYDYGHQLVDLSLAGETDARFSIEAFDKVRQTVPDVTDSWTNREYLDFVRSVRPEQPPVYGQGETLKTWFVVSELPWDHQNGDDGTECKKKGGGCGGGGGGKLGSCSCGSMLFHLEKGGDMCCKGAVDFGVGGGSIVCHFDFSHVGTPEPQRGQDVSEGGVSLINGDFVHQVTDISVFDTGGEIEFTRTYRSGVEYEGPLGYNWISNWGEMVFISTDADHPEECGEAVRWVKPDGSYTQYNIGPGGLGVGPPDSLYQLKKVSATKYLVRDVSGAVRIFEEAADADDHIPLSKLQRGSNELQLLYDSEERLTTIISAGQARLGFTYTAGRLTQVTNALDPNDWVQYQYNDGPGGCGDLARVIRPATALYPLDTPAGPSTTHYDYWRVNPADCNNASHTNHLLVSIKTDQENPIDLSQGVEVVLQNLYDTQGEAPTYFTVGQCFGNKLTCDDASADLEYEYDWTGLYGVRIVDHRLGTEVRELHEFNDSRLVKLVEDEGGLNRETTYAYNANGLVERTTFADGSCEVINYTQAAGSFLPLETRQRPQVTCGQEPSPHLDRVTVRFYEAFSGRVKSVTGPEAFTNGDTSEFYSLGGAHSEPYKKYSTFYFYDFEERPVTDAAKAQMTSSCVEWANVSSFGCPWTPGSPGGPVELNGDPGDDANWFGNLVKVARYVPADDDQPPRAAGDLAALNVYRSDGRLLRQRGPDGVRTEYVYYDDPAGAWDWRQSHAAGAAQHGPLAIKRIEPNDVSQCQPTTGCLETRYAYSAKNRLIARQNPQTIISENSVAASGNILSTKICKGACTAAEDTLSTTEFTYDLRGRLLDRSVFEPDEGSDPQLVAQTRTTYDDLGRPVTNTVDPAGLQLLSQTAYDDRGRVVQTISPEGRISCLSYDSLNRLKETRQLSNAEAQNCSAGSFSEGDVVTKTEYDAMGRPVIETDPEGIKGYRWYDIHGQLEFVSDGRPDAAYAPTFLGTPPALPSTFQWYSQTSHDLAGRAIRERFFGRGHEEEDVPRVFLRASWQEYDSLGRPTASHVGLAYLDVPEAEANSLTVPSPNPAEGFDLATVRAYYDDKGKRRKVVDPEGRATTFDYDGFGRPKTTFLPTASPHPADTVLTEYDAAGRRRKTTNTIHDPEDQPHTRVAEIAYDHWGRTLRTTGDPQGQSLITEFGYDVLGRATTTVRRWWDLNPPDPSQALGSINTHDRVVKVAYDAAGRAHEQRVRESESPDVWATTILTYDDDGLLLSMKDAENRQTDFQYDLALGRLARMLYPLEDSKRQTIEYAQYNKRGQPTQVQYRADNDDQAARVTRTMTYDNRGRPTSRTAVAANAGTTVFFGTTEQSFAYDDLGRLIRGTDHSPAFGDEQDITVRSRYDSAGRRIEENQLLPLTGGFPEHFVISEFDRAGFRTELMFPDHGQATPYTIQYSSDWRGRLSTIEAPTDPSSPASAPRALVNYGYVGGQVWERNYSNGTALRMYEPAPVGQTTRPLLYDGLGRPTAIQTAADNWGTVRPALPDFRYGYDRIGNLMYEQRRHEETQSDPEADPEYRTRAYSTDPMGRLGAWAEGSLPELPGALMLPTTTDPAGVVPSPTNAESWQLDLVGNWDVKTTGVAPSQMTDDYQINALNQYAKVGTDPSDPVFTHDWLGQLREDESKNKKYTWDLFGRLTKVEVETQGTCNPNGYCSYYGGPACPNGPSDCVHYSLQSRYRYDALNRRVETSIPSPGPATDAITRYIYDGWRVIEEHAVAGNPPGQTETVRARYGHGIGLDELLWMDRDVPRSGSLPDPWQGVPDGTIESRYFVHHDLLGSTVALTDDVDAEDATIIERFTYGAYGEVQAWHAPIWNDTNGYGTASALSKVGLPFLYTGQRYEPVTGLHYYKNRILDPSTGRFISRDPLGYRTGPLLYGLADGSPNRRVDPLGLASWDDPYAYHNPAEIAIHSTHGSGRCGRNVYCMSGVSRLPESRSIYDGWKDTPGAEGRPGATRDTVDTSHCPSVDACNNPGAYSSMLVDFGFGEYGGLEQAAEGKLAPYELEPYNGPYEADYVEVVERPRPGQVYPADFMGPLGANDLRSQIPTTPFWVDTNANVEEAARHRFNIFWFRNQVRGHGPWDYKQFGPEYENFGNWHFGRTGRAVGIPLSVLLREAGRAQEEDGTSDPEWGDPPLVPLSPWGGTGSFGDDPWDQFWIQQGFGEQVPGGLM